MLHLFIGFILYFRSFEDVHMWHEPSSIKLFAFYVLVELKFAYDTFHRETIQCDGLYCYVFLILFFLISVRFSVAWFGVDKQQI